MSEVVLKKSLLNHSIEQVKVKEKRISNKPKKNVLEPYGYLLPCLILFGTFVYFPFVKTIYLSLALTNRRGKAVEFVGLGNYKEIFASEAFYNSLFVTFRFVLMIIIPCIGIGLLLALLVNHNIKGKRIYEVMFSMPMAIASAPAAIIWTMIFHPTNGIANALLKTDIRWLADPKTALWAIALVTIWLGVGINFIFLLTGLKSIPAELIESAEIDGARYTQKLRCILLPLLTPQMFFVIFMNIVNAFQAFGQIKLLTQGGPGDATNVLVYGIYKEAFVNGRFDMASTQSIILFVIVFTITMVQFAFEKKGVHYQ
ncbi:carbohydrate ABC transporter permease [Cellulosilyticum sp. I15G10I2]|uniref:carbohydrate ABC transporter permease n=1 Tax=Cellulosilyticum sp. I15G10I2 TaxID=1892843 RepID=UPI0009F5C67C|nr:sugar ABC transporter permease [Cellulosilyticum sp. I15G10I2]